MEAEDGAGKRAEPGQELAGESDEGEIDLDEEKSRVNNVLDSILGGSSRGDDDYFEEIEEGDGPNCEFERTKDVALFHAGLDLMRGGGAVCRVAPPPPDRGQLRAGII